MLTLVEKDFEGNGISLKLLTGRDEGHEGPSTSVKSQELKIYTTPSGSESEDGGN